MAKIIKSNENIELEKDKIKEKKHGTK
jgi:hypothetical protein